MFAIRDCVEGEELCISYIGGVGNAMEVGRRRKRLMGWFGMECRCAKCVGESAVLKGEEKGDRGMEKKNLNGSAVPEQDEETETANSEKEKELENGANGLSIN